MNKGKRYACLLSADLTLSWAYPSNYSRSWQSWGWETGGRIHGWTGGMVGIERSLAWLPVAEYSTGRDG